MPRLMVFSDIHGDVHALRKAMDVEADYYFMAGDLVNWGRGLDKMAEAMLPKADRVYVLPGNHESAADIAELCERHGFHDFHGGDSRGACGGTRVFVADAVRHSR